MKQAGLALSSAQRGAIVRDSPISRAETPGEMSMLRMAELVEMLSDRASLNKREAKEMVKAFFEVMRDALESGEDVQLSGFGKFQLREKSQRPGRNPKTGETTSIEVRRVVTFHASQKLKARLELDGEQRRRDRL
ncbi:integration host factor subunit alpha [Paraburkholderia sp. BL8N3]|nr:integration host factor subunit alpha [Paraburkholderia sp. BL8N3]TCK33698.1 integration host factor subunit alpha [Paraburkholderia sp. BL8N3]